MIGRGELVPTFTLPSLERGEPVALESLTASGPVLLFFFKLDCSATDLAAPFVQLLADSYGDHVSAEGTRLLVIGVAQEDAAGAKGFSDQHSLRFPILLDQELEVSRAFDLECTPTLVLLRGAERLRADSATVSPREALRVADLIEGWSRDAMELLSEEIAARIGSIPAELFAEADQVPASRPG